MKNSKIISNPRVIAGLYREAIFARIPVKIDSLISSEVIDVNEKDRRELNEVRQVTFSMECLRTNSRDVCKVDLLFSNFIISGELLVIQESARKIVCAMPDLLHSIDFRKSRRIDVNSSNLPFASAICVCNGIHHEVIFRLENMSRYGFAGQIEVDRDFDLLPRSRFTGVIHTSDSSLKLNGTVIEVREFSRRGDLKILNLRVIRDEVTDANDSKHLEKRKLDQDFRKEPRFKSQISLKFLNFFAAHQSIEVSVNNVSISGFSGKCITPFMNEYLLPGIPIQLVASSMVAEIILSEDSQIRCRWINGNNKDRGKWLKNISESISENTVLNVPDASQLLEIFCGSGAFSSQFLQSQRKKFRSISSGIEMETIESSYIHRWLDRPSGNEPIGHISCIRMGDNVWFATDLVKSADSHVKFSKNFVQKFLHSFSLHAMSLTPVPRIFLIWTKGHPFWLDLYEKLIVAPHPESYEVAIGYRRTTQEDDSIFNKLIEFLPVLPIDYSKIMRAHTQIGSVNVVEVVKAFDFDIDRFGSTKLGHAINADKKPFQRVYFETISENFSGITILTMLPDGMNPNRVIDSAWFFEYAEHPIMRDADWVEYVKAVRILGAKLGMSIPGVRRISDRDKHINFSSDHAYMNGFLVHPYLMQKFY